MFKTPLRNFFFPLTMSLCAGCIVPSSLRAADLPTEEITVTNITVKNLRADLENAEDRMHKIFNSLVDDDDFKIICEDVVVTGSLIEHRVCEPNFRRQAKIKDFRDGIDGGNERMRYIRRSDQLNRELAAKSEEMLKRMEELARENPDLLQALAEVLSLRNAIAAAGGEP